MHKQSMAVLALVAFGLLFVGCEQISQPVGPETPALSEGEVNPIASQFDVPENAVLDKVELHVWVNQSSDGTVKAYRITTSWDENTVTWNNFGAGYDGTPEGSFQPNALDWRTAEITDMFMGWLNGTFDNYGVLIKEDPPLTVSPRAKYDSRESSSEENRPFVRLTFVDDEGEHTVDLPVIADTYIWERNPDTNYGSEPDLYTGNGKNPGVKKSLLRVEVPEISLGCTRTIGYWKTHAGFGPQPDMVTDLLPVWLGTAGEEMSLAVTTAAIAVDVLNMHTYGHPSNGITKLYAQLLATKLNIASGASVPAMVSDAIMDADAFLADNDDSAWSELSDEDQQMVLDWKDTLDAYNNGDIGPGHCDEFEDEEDEGGGPGEGNRGGKGKGKGNGNGPGKGRP